MEYRIERLRGSVEEIAEKLNAITEEGWALHTIGWRDKHEALCVLEKSAVYTVTLPDTDTMTYATDAAP